ncbi:major facilitator superfamily transporter [Colletotrichum truncatum]|uniref:Major facilitator superfamily transporter n=1 Tax=Colletotrichum truncatum TaxID=5467 RepID=A0ACC3YDN7_COLTU
MLLEAALCGISAGLFRIIEAVIAIASLKPWNKGKALGYWLIYRLCGLILGGVINLGLKTDNNQAERVSYAVSTTIQAAGTFVRLFLNKLERVERQDETRARCIIGLTDKRHHLFCGKGTPGTALPYCFDFSRMVSCLA